MKAIQIRTSGDPAEGQLLSLRQRVAFAEAKLTELYERKFLDKFKKGMIR